MKKTSLSSLLVVLSVSFLAKCGPSEIEVGGQVFIVTQGGTNFKLGLVEVRAIEEPRILSFVEGKKQNIRSIVDERLKEFRDKCARELAPMDQHAKELAHELRGGDVTFKDLVDYCTMIEGKKQEFAKEEPILRRHIQIAIWLEGLPLPIQMAKTDADGNFVLRLRPGRYALAAEASRKIVDKSEDYYWLIWLEVGKKNKNKVFLSNDNLIGTFSPECVVKATDIPK